MFALLGIAWLTTTLLAGWLIWQCVRFLVWMRRNGSVTIQLMTAEERLEQERFVEHARKRAWKELYLEVGNG
jgi:hypothetical protein